MKTYQNYFICLREGVPELRTIAETKEESKALLVSQHVQKTWTELRRMGYACLPVDVNLIFKTP